MEERNLSSLDYVVQRDIFDELHQQDVAKKGTWITEPTLGQRMKESLR